MRSINVVFFYDYWDLAVSFLLFVTMAALELVAYGWSDGQILTEYKFTAQQTQVIMYAPVALLILYNFWVPFVRNRFNPVVAILVAVGRLAVSIFGVLVFFVIGGPAGSGGRNSKEANLPDVLGWLSGLALIGWFIKRLVNGHEVEAIREESW